jgi:hypothetical protein
VTVIAAGFDRWDGDVGHSASARAPEETSRPAPAPERPSVDLFAGGGDEDLGDDDFDVPSFLK